MTASTWRSTVSRLERAASKLAAAERELVEAVLAANRQGLSLREIGGFIGKSHTHVSRLLAANARRRR